MPRKKKFRLSHKKSHRRSKETAEQRARRLKLEYLEDIYFKASSPIAYSTFENLYNYLKQHKPGIYSREFVRSWLDSIDEYTLHRHRKRAKHFAHIYVPRPGHSIDVDVGFFKLAGSSKNSSSQKESNKVPEKMLIAVDLFSKFLAVEPLQDLKAENVVNAMKNILKHFPNLQTVRHDLGQEFRSNLFQNLLLQNNIKSIRAYPPRKATNAERALRSYKALLMKLLQHKGEIDFTKVLQDALNIYNHRSHTSLDMLTPIEAMKDMNIGRIKRFILNKHIKSAGPPIDSFEFNIGAPVRIEVDRGPFDKEHKPKYSEEVYFVDRQKRRDNVNYYYLKTVDGEEVEGAFHERELVPTNISQFHTKYKLELVRPETRRIGNTTYKAVTFKDFPDKIHWVPEQDIFELK